MKIEGDSLTKISNEYQTKVPLLMNEIERLHTILNSTISKNTTDMNEIQ